MHTHANMNMFGKVYVGDYHAYVGCPPDGIVTLRIREGKRNPVRLRHQQYQTPQYTHTYVKRIHACRLRYLYGLL